MKLLWSSLPLLLFSHLAIAVDYLMPTEVLKTSLVRQNKINENLKPNHCEEIHPKFHINDGVDFQHFKADIDCRFSCKGEKFQSIQIQKNFNTSNLNMRRGDGNLWASLSTSLSMWSREKCLLEAQNLCSGLENIELFKTPKVSSGNWILQDKLSCHENSPIILSPFEKTIKTIKSFTYNRNEESSKLEIEQTWNSFRPIGHFNYTYVMPTNCKNEIKGSFCYGDCITLNDNEPFKELLSSPNPLGNDDYTFCADELVKKISSKKISKDVIEFYCEDFFISELKKLSVTGLTCASSRISVNCTNLKIPQNSLSQ